MSSQTKLIRKKLSDLLNAEYPDVSVFDNRVSSLWSEDFPSISIYYVNSEFSRRQITATSYFATGYFNIEILTKIDQGSDDESEDHTERVSKFLIEAAQTEPLLREFNLIGQNSEILQQDSTSPVLKSELSFSIQYQI